METEEKHGREIERFSLVILVFAFLLILLYFLLISKGMEQRKTQVRVARGRFGAAEIGKRNGKGRKIGKRDRYVLPWYTKNYTRHILHTLYILFVQIFS